MLQKHENDYEVAPRMSSMSSPNDMESEEDLGAVGGSARETTSSQRGPRIYRRPTSSSTSRMLAKEGVSFSSIRPVGKHQYPS